MKIFNIDTDTINTQWVTPRVEDKVLDLLTFDCETKYGDFDKVEWYILNPKKKRSNFYIGMSGTLVFDEEVFDSEIFPLFEMAGEILELKMEKGNVLYALNVMECIDVLNPKKTIWNYYEDGTQGQIRNPVFYSDGYMESSIFKIPETSRAEIFTYSGMKNEDDEFYSLYKKLGFTGLVFEEIPTG
ncbi:hypothetical protein G7074_21715 [Pedobacter sp. HDW13]|uniref:hypothetical protein n=1 Tax=Pedobacter sp. HDW13 TaxID=2714940 RepID=UPI00140CCD2E|nr:hypothetical protein [Pedobacter sp. HDW13]QIL41652.1 hypothetical protein G7074_21715 [Pedobacter sp. HDW13]